MRRHRGLLAMTLVEILIGATLLTVIFGGLWGASHFSGRTTQRTMLQADCLRRAALLFRMIQQKIDRCERVLYPGPGARVDCLVLRHWSGVHELVYLTPSRQHVVACTHDESKAFLLVEMGDTPAYILRLVFCNRSADELAVIMSFCDGTGAPIPGATDIVGTVSLKGAR